MPRGLVPQEVRLQDLDLDDSETGSHHHRSTRLPLHPVWPRPVAGFPWSISGRARRRL